MSWRMFRYVSRGYRMRYALKLISGDRCENYTGGGWQCFRNGRIADAKYGADRACDACIAAWALDPGMTR